MSCGRAPLALGLLLVAVPAQAHGEQVLYLILGGAWAVPALLLLAIPWGRWWARIATVAVLAIAGAASLHWFGRIGAYLFIFGPPVAGLVTAVCLSLLTRKQLGTDGAA